MAALFGTVGTRKGWLWSEQAKTIHKHAAGAAESKRGRSSQNIIRLNFFYMTSFSTKIFKK